MAIKKGLSIKNLFTLLNFKSFFINISLFLILCILIFCSQKPRLDLPFTENEGMFTCAAQEMVDFHSKLYLDVWDHKPPLFFAQAWLLREFFPLDEVHVHLCVLCIHCLIAFLILLIGRKLQLTNIGYWSSPFFYCFLITPPLLQPWTPQSDLLMQPFLLLSFYVGISKKPMLAILSGIFWGCAFFTKQTALFYLPVYIFLIEFKQLPRFSFFVLGVDLISAVIALPFLLDGRIQLFWQAITGFNELYVLNGWWQILHIDFIRNAVFYFHKIFLATYVMPLVGIFLSWFLCRGKNGEIIYSMILIWFLCGLTGCFASGHFFPYYYLSVLAPTSLILGCVFKQWINKKDYWLTGFFILLFIWIGALWTNLFSIEDYLFARCQYSTMRFRDAKEMGMFIKEMSKPDDSLLSWTAEPQLYTYSGLKMAVVTTPMVNQLAGIPEEMEKSKENIEINKPRFCVTTKFNQVVDMPVWIKRSLEKEYSKVKEIGLLDLYISDEKR